MLKDLAVLEEIQFTFALTHPEDLKLIHSMNVLIEN